jgi:hypothetical protein
MTTNLQMIGNAALLDLPDKVAFLSSRRISAADVLKCYEWAEKIHDTKRHARREALWRLSVSFSRPCCFCLC